jgi:cytochrome c peroxidase
MKKILLLLVPFLFSCSKDEQNQIIQQDFVLSDYLDINWESLPEYVAIDYPVHYSGPILQNTNQPLDNLTTNPGATLGRVLFYDKKLSLNNTVSCASCHHQDNGFTDAMIFSITPNFWTLAGLDIQIGIENFIDMISGPFSRPSKPLHDADASFCIVLV